MQPIYAKVFKDKYKSIFNIGSKTRLSEDDQVLEIIDERSSCFLRFSVQNASVITTRCLNIPNTSIFGVVSKSLSNVFLEGIYSGSHFFGKIYSNVS